MIARVIGIQGCGKNILMTIMADFWVKQVPEVYSYDRIYANYHLLYPGSHYLTNKEMKLQLRRMFGTLENGGEMQTGQWDNTIVLIDEIDGLYPQWGHGDKEAQKDLSGAYQDEKMHVQMYCTTHKPNNFNKILRDAAEVIAIPDYDKAEDTIYIKFIDGRYRSVNEMTIHPASAYFGVYRRDEKVI
jgi:ATPase family associated with various cellular activities (AAA).